LAQNSASIVGVAEADDFFGSALAAGDFNGDGFDDLAIGVPFESFAANFDGVVNVIYGSASGLTATGNEFWSQDSAGIQGVAEALDRFGWVMAAANFGRTSAADLAIGVPFESLAATLWSQNSSGIAGDADRGTSSECG
jgi:hypothetical protein